MSFWSVHLPALSASRVALRSTRDGAASKSEWIALLALGLAAGMAAAMPDLGLKIPGHAILRSVFPCALGLAIAPRQGAGCLMAASGLFSAGAIYLLGGHGIGLGAATSLGLTGPLLDASLTFIRRSWHVHVAFVLAALLSNLAAFLVKLVEKLTTGGGPALETWIARAIPSYLVCGALAGCISSLIWFRVRLRRESPDQ